MDRRFVRPRPEPRENSVRESLTMTRYNQSEATPHVPEELATRGMYTAEVVYTSATGEQRTISRTATNTTPSKVKEFALRAVPTEATVEQSAVWPGAKEARPPDEQPPERHDELSVTHD